MNCSLPHDEFSFGTSCCLLQEGKSSICIVRRRSTSLERRAVFLREESLLLYLLLPLDQFGTSCHFPQGGKTLFIIAQLDVLFDFPPLDEFGTSCCLSTLFAFYRST